MASEIRPHVSDLDTEPVVRRFYRVPCLRVGHDSRFPEWSWVPVLGPKHIDPELGFPLEHWHVDWRFISRRTVSDVFWSEEPIGARSFQNVINNNILSEPEDRLMRCLRKMPNFPNVRRQRGGAPWLDLLETQYADTRLKCRTCPHRGMSLKGLPEDDQGRVVCPGHGLRWNVRTGELSPRLAVTP